MSREKEFIKRLTELMDEYDVELRIDVQRSLSGEAYSAELLFHTDETCCNFIFGGWDTDVTVDMIRSEREIS